MYDVVIIGAGAAGVFAAIHAAKNRNKTLILEKTKVPLAKVKISGGGRCNVTHNCYDPKTLTQNYPRGAKELLGPFHTFGPKNTVDWFTSRGVPLKAEEDGRMFPKTNTSATIINCLLSEAKKNGADLSLKATVTDIEKTENGFIIHQKQAPAITTKKLILATGSSPAGHAFAKNLGHTIEKPLPSLFTFNIPNSPLAHLSGIATQETKLTLKEANLSMLGPLLITHFGFSGPAALKLSAFGAIYLHEKNYHAPLTIDWLPSSTPHQTTQKLLNAKTNTPTATLQSIHLLPLPKNLQKALFPTTFTTKISTLSNKALTHLAEKIHQDTYQIDGKTTNKEEFVTCGGVKLSEINFKTMESKVCPNLYLAGEILNIDGITGGFNFQAAWTTAYLASP